MLRRHPSTLFLVAVLSIGLWAAPVGASVSGKPLPVKTWRKVANDICRQSDILLNDIADEVFADVSRDGQPSLELMSTYVTQAEPVVQQRIDSIDALQEPKNLRKKVAKLLATAQEELDAWVADPSIGLEANPFSATVLASKKLTLKQCS